MVKIEKIYNECPNDTGIKISNQLLNTYEKTIV